MQVYTWIGALQQMGCTAELSKHKANLKPGISVAVCVYDKLVYCLKRELAAQKPFFPSSHFKSSSSPHLI